MQRHKWFTVPALIAVAGLLLTVAPTLAKDEDRARLRCSAEGTADISMDAKFESRDGRQKLDVSFEAFPGGDFVAGQTLDVFVSGAHIGTMVLMRSVAGDLEGDLNFDTSAQANDDDLPFPAGFPSIGEGVSVVVGSLGCDLD